MNRKMRVMALALAALMLFFTFTALAFIFHEHSHNCTEDDCPICAAILFCRNALEAICFIAAFIFCSCFFVAAFSASAVGKRAIIVTPVRLKVKMTN